MSNTDHPSHYNSGKIEVIDFIEDQNLGFNLGNTIKYIARARHKGNYIEDLKKALWYLKREIDNSEKGLSPKPNDIELTDVEIQFMKDSSNTNVRKIK